MQTWFNTERALALSSLRDRVVVLVAFQVLCPKSVSQGIPQAQRIFETFEPGDVTVIGLHATFEHHDAFNPAMLKAFIHEYRLKFPIALDQPNAASPIPHTMERYKMRGTPSLVLIDRQGLVRTHTFGAADDLRIGAENRCAGPGTELRRSGTEFGGLAALRFHLRARTAQQRPQILDVRRRGDAVRRFDQGRGTREITVIDGAVHGGQQGQRERLLCLRRGGAAVDDLRLLYVPAGVVLFRSMR